MARIAVGGFWHATNSFAPTLATWDEFERGCGWPPLTRGDSLFDAVEGYNLALDGFIAEVRALGHEPVPTLWAAASASGPVTEDAYERIAGMLLEDLAERGPLDAIYLSLHGAMVAEHIQDGEGELLRRVRELAGPTLPVVATLDYHANVSPDMARLATALIGNRTYPHVDMAETGRRAARLLADLLESRRPIHTSFRQIPFLIPLPWGCTSAEPAASIIRLLEGVARPEGTNLSFATGFPLADTEHGGPSVYGCGPNPAAVEAAVERLAAEVAAREAQWTGRLHDPEAAVAEAVRRAGAATGPVVLADVQDDPGSGGTGDTMNLLKALIRQGAEGASLGLVYDPHVATLAHRCGEGSDIAVCLGAKHGVEGDSSLDAVFRVERLGDGKFTCTGPFYRGARMELAPMACLRLGGVRVVVAGKKVEAADQAMFRHLGIDPATERILALKSSVEFRADFEPIADSVLLVAGPGAVETNPARLCFTRLRTGVRRGPAQ